MSNKEAFFASAQISMVAGRYREPDPEGLRMQVRPLKRYIDPKRLERLERMRAHPAAQGKYVPESSYWTSHDGLFRLVHAGGSKAFSHRGWAVDIAMCGYTGDYARRDELAGFYLPGQMVAKKLLADFGFDAVRFTTLKEAVAALELAIDMGLEGAYREQLARRRAGVAMDEYEDAKDFHAYN